MKIQDLKQPYRALAEMRREQQINSEWVKQYEKEFKEINDLNFAFYWENTPEGNDWWNYLNEGSTPEIPAASLEELKEWQKEHPEYEPVLIAEQQKDFDTPFNTKALSSQDPDPRLFQAAVAAMQGMLIREKMPYVERLCNDCWDLAEALINEGKKRGHL